MTPSTNTRDEAFEVDPWSPPADRHIDEGTWGGPDGDPACTSTRSAAVEAEPLQPREEPSDVRIEHPAAYQVPAQELVDAAMGLWLFADREEQRAC
jgi:hypothetical protein